MSGAAPATADVAVVGAGVVGLACAAALAGPGRTVVILERREAIAREVTSRSSEVIHAGLSYPPDSWKARLCVRGRELLYARCARRGLPHRRTGKLVVAVEEAELPALERLAANAQASGAGEVELVDAGRVRALEPAVAARAALVSPRSGILDVHALALDLLAEAEAGGAVLVLRAALRGAQRRAHGWRLAVADADGRPAALACAAVVNAAGLDADRVAALAGADPDALGWRIRPCKGDYFALAPGAPLRLAHLVYPLPARDGSLGVHATLDLAGRIRFGPDAEYVETPRYDVDPAKAPAFAAAAGRYLPALRAAWLAPGYAGVRPRLTAPGEAARDFVVEEGSARGRPGWVDLVGIESPGITAALALGERVAGMLASL